MPTVVVNDDGQVDQEKRRGRVNVRPASGNSGVLYEMGIPVIRFADYPFHVDVQQKIPLAEQRNEPDERWHQRYLIPGLLEMVIDDLSVTQLRKEWAVGAIEATFKNELKEHYVETVVRDGRKKDLVVSSGEAADDKCENHGYQVFDTGRASSATASIVKSVAKSSREIARNLEEREKERVAPTSAQRSFIETMESLARDIGFDQVSIETWKIEESFSDDTSLAQYNNEEGIVRLNVNEASWDELRPQLVGTVFHELAHINTTGHGTPFRDELERIAGAATIELLEQDDG